MQPFIHSDVINDSSLMVRCSWLFTFLAVRGCSQLCSHADVINDSLLMVVFLVVPVRGRSWLFVVRGHAAVQMSSMIADYSRL